VPSAGKKCLTIKSTGIAVDENDSIVSCFYINVQIVNLFSNNAGYPLPVQI
jgi:hypothetical protein